MYGVRRLKVEDFGVYVCIAPFIQLTFRSRKLTKQFEFSNVNFKFRRKLLTLLVN